jgi:hypothetical protein
MISAKEYEREGESKSLTFSIFGSDKEIARFSVVIALTLLFIVCFSYGVKGRNDSLK